MTMLSISLSLLKSTYNYVKAAFKKYRIPTFK